MTDRQDIREQHNRIAKGNRMLNTTYYLRQNTRVEFEDLKYLGLYDEENYLSPETLIKNGFDWKGLLKGMSVGDIVNINPERFHAARSAAAQHGTRMGKKFRARKRNGEVTLERLE